MWQYHAKVLRVVDGDTLDLLVDLGFQSFLKIRARLYGIDTPEKYGVKKGSPEWEAGVKATAFVEHWLATHCRRTAGNWLATGLHEEVVVLIRSHDGKQLGQGKYGRWLVEVYPTTADPEADLSLNRILVDEGHAEVAT